MFYYFYVNYVIPKGDDEDFRFPKTARIKAKTPTQAGKKLYEMLEDLGISNVLGTRVYPKKKIPVADLNRAKYMQEYRKKKKKEKKKKQQYLYDGLNLIATENCEQDILIID